MSFEIVSAVINGLVAKTELTDVSIVRRLYTHGTAQCTLATDDQAADTYAALAEIGAQTLNADVLLQWHSKDESETVDCFRGYVRAVRAERIEHRAYLHFECVSYSARLDQIRNFRVWESCTLKDVCAYLISKNQGALDFGEGGASAAGAVPIPLSVQYEETDFAYLSRMLHAWGIPLAIDDLNRKTLIGKPSVPAGAQFPSADWHWNTTSLQAGLVPIQTTAQGTGSGAGGTARGKVLEFNAALTRTPGHLYEPRADAPHHTQYQQAQNLEDATNFDVNTTVCRARWMGGVYDFAPGALVDFADQQWLVREVTIQGHGSEAVAQEFSLLDKLLPLVPRYRRTTWPTQCLWAHVTKNTSADPTQSGRIQVEFDWEPLEVTPFTRLCWLQTVTPYGGLKGSKDAGGTSGFLSLPEVGEHVLVQFLDAWDSDAVILGSVREHAAQGFAYVPDEAKRWQTPSGNQVSMTTKDKGATDIVEIRCKDKLIFRGEIEGGKETVVMDLTSSPSERIHFEKGSGPAQLDIFCGGSIYVHADDRLMLEAGTIQMKATKGAVKIDGTPLVMINCGPTSMSPLSLAVSSGAGGAAVAAKSGTAKSKSRVPGLTQAQADAALKKALKNQRRLLELRKAQINRWNAKDQQQFKKWFGNTDQASRDKMLKVIDNELDLNKKMTLSNFQAAPTPDPNTFAYVHPNDPSHTIYIDGHFANAPALGRDSQAGTLAHEMSHFTSVAGTNDHVYGASSAAALARTDPTKAMDNADNFEFFIEGGK